MIQIQPYSLADATHNSVYSDCNFVAQILKERLPPEEQSLGEPFMTALQAYKTALDATKERVGVDTKAADKQTDNIWIALNHLLKAHLLHFDPEIQLAAQKVNAIFRSFEMPIRLTYKKAYGIYDRMVMLMRALPPEILEKSGAAPWIDELERRMQAFVTLKQSHLSQKKEEKTAVTRNARKALLQAYSALVMQLNAKLVLTPSEELEQLAQSWNGFIDQQRAIARSAATRKRNAALKAQASESQDLESTPDASSEHSAKPQQQGEIPGSQITEG